jgi:predicted protein tyrosine phosphatase
VTAPELIVLSRDKAERYEPQGVEICISISDPEAPPAKLSPRFAAVLRLEFSDIMSAGSIASEVLFAAEQAQQVVDFLARWPHAERVVVHCLAGVSRSPGIALGVCDIRGWPTSALERRYPFWNSHVRNLLALAASRAHPAAESRGPRAES